MPNAKQRTPDLLASRRTRSTTLRVFFTSPSVNSSTWRGIAGSAASENTSCSGAQISVPP